MNFAPRAVLLPRKPSAKRVEEAVQRFRRDGQSGAHSPVGWLLAGICEWCVANDVPFVLVRMPGGYMIYHVEARHMAQLGMLFADLHSPVEEAKS